MSQQTENIMKEIRLEKVVLNMGVGKSGDAIEIAKKALDQISGKKSNSRNAKKAQRDWGVRKNEPIGVAVTVRSNDAKELLNHFAHRRIGARSFWRSLSAQTPYSQMPKSLNGLTAGISGKTVSLPCSSNLTDSEQDYVIEALDDWTGHLMPKT